MVYARGSCVMIVSSARVPTIVFPLNATKLLIPVHTVMEGINHEKV